MKCDNMESGCQWEGTVCTLEEHEGVCEFALVPCPKECKDDNEILRRFLYSEDDSGILKITRRDLQQHLMECPNRDYSCEHCDLKGTYATTLDHYDTCEKKILSCANEECTMEMERMKIKNHLSEECEHTVISCKYTSIGCDVKLKRKDMSAHEQDDKAHLNKTVDTIIKLKEDNEILTAWKNKVDKSESTVFKVTEFSNNERFYSPSFYTSPNGYNLDIEVHANHEGDGEGSHVSVYVYIIKGKYDDELNWPFVGKVTIELLNQLEDKNHYNQVLQFTPEMNKRVGDPGFGYHRYISHSELSRDWAANTQYFKDDTLYFRISVEVPDHKPWLQCTV